MADPVLPCSETRQLFYLPCRAGAAPDPRLRELPRSPTISPEESGGKTGSGAAGEAAYSAVNGAAYGRRIEWRGFI
jgi:hypothetical protein